MCVSWIHPWMGPGGFPIPLHWLLSDQEAGGWHGQRQQGNPTCIFLNFEWKSKISLKGCEDHFSAYEKDKCYTNMLCSLYTFIRGDIIICLIQSLDKPNTSPTPVFFVDFFNTIYINMTAYFSCQLRQLVWQHLTSWGNACQHHAEESRSGALCR